MEILSGLIEGDDAVVPGVRLERTHGLAPLMVVTDTIGATPEMKTCPNLRTISIAPLLGEAMRRINNEASVLARSGRYVQAEQQLRQLDAEAQRRLTERS